MDISKTGNGAGQLTVPDFANMNIILPDRKEQDVFAKYVLDIYKKIDKLEQELIDIDISKDDLLNKYFK